MTALLYVDNIRVYFGGVRAVDGVTFSLEPGRLYGLVGPNGSGKTTLINAISGVTRPTSGRIRFNGQDMTTPASSASRAGIVRTFQGIKLLPTLTVRENVQLGADWHLVDAPEDSAGGNRHKIFSRRHAVGLRRRRATATDEALERLRLGRFADHVPQSLPYGTQRRVEIARALAGRPRLLLLDEPIAGMNREERAEIADTIKELSTSGLVQLVVEHDLRTLLRISDQLFVMNFGELIAEGEPEQTASQPAVREAYLGRQHVAT